MTDSILAITITFADEATALSFATECPSADQEVVRKSNLDGSPTTWLLVANVALAAIPHLITFLQQRRDSKKIKKVVLKDYGEFEGTTPDELIKVLSELRTGKSK